MTSKERVTRMFRHQEADRVPIMDLPWNGTIRRWHREGMPEGMDWQDYFEVDKYAAIAVDISPQYPKVILSENERSYVQTSQWGATMRHFKEEDSTPEFLDFKVVTEEDWAECKARMLADGENRVDWDYLKKNYPLWQKEGRWIRANFWFGFDVAHSWMMGTENHLVAMYEDPDLVVDMYNTYLDCCIKQFEKIWDEGYRFDTIWWWDDMGYKGSTFFSNELYRELLKPVHKRAIDWAHNRGIFAELHSCGDIMTRIDDLVDLELDALNPLEVKAGMKPLELKENYGDKLAFHGGINAVLWDDKEAVIEAVRATVPTMKEDGGYIFASDHSIPNTVTLENFKAIIDEVKRVGTY